MSARLLILPKLQRRSLDRNRTAGAKRYRRSRHLLNRPHGRDILCDLRPQLRFGLSYAHQPPQVRPYAVGVGNGGQEPFDEPRAGDELCGHSRGYQGGQDAGGAALHVASGKATQRGAGGARRAAGRPLGSPRG